LKTSFIFPKFHSATNRIIKLKRLILSFFEKSQEKRLLISEIRVY
jgi:hypothetical protein